MNKEELIKDLQKVQELYNQNENILPIEPLQVLKNLLGIRSPSQDYIEEGKKWVEECKKGFEDEDIK